MDDKKIRVVIADDSKFMRELIKQVLSRIESIEIVGEASDGENTVRVVEELKPDILVLDINMPRINGIEVLKILRERGINTKVLVVSSLAQAHLVEEAKKYGVKEYIIKPFKPFELLAAIKNALE